MRRFFCENILKTCTLSKETTHHIQKVLRIKVGAKIIIFNNESWAIAKIMQYDNDRTTVEVIDEIYTNTKKTLTLDLICALPKQQRLSTLIEKISEVGCDSFTPLYTSRSAVKLHPDKVEDRLQRWTRIAISATTQSKQVTPTTFKPPVNLKNILPKENALNLIFTTEGNSQDLQTVLKLHPKMNICALIGPEGGFADNEIDNTIQKQFIPVHLNLPVLRIETAAIIASAIIKMYQQTPN